VVPFAATVAIRAALRMPLRTAFRVSLQCHLRMPLWPALRMSLGCDHRISLRRGVHMSLLRVSGVRRGAASRKRLPMRLLRRVDLRLGSW
jgi:hypothetical protein